MPRSDGCAASARLVRSCPAETAWSATRRPALRACVHGLRNPARSNNAAAHLSVSPVRDDVTEIAELLHDWMQSLCAKHI